MRVGRTERHLDIHAAVVLALLVGVRARDVDNRNRVAVDAERPWLPAQRESRAAAFAGGARGPVNSPYIHDAISEGTGTPSKRFTAVAPALPSMPLTVVVLACTSIPNAEQHLGSMVCFAMADPFHACGTAPAPIGLQTTPL